MTAPTTALTEVIRSRNLLFDFDGPICAIFAGLSASSVAAHLRDTMKSHGIDVPATVETADDPFDVFRFAATVSGDLAEQVEVELRTMETRATDSASPTPNAREVIKAARAAGRSVAVVSNNSQQAITRYLTMRGLAPFCNVLVGRSDADPRHLKPSPHLITQAIKELGAEASDSVLIGDSLSDIEGARNAGALSIGYANKPGKLERFAKASADAVITSMSQLLPVLATSSTPDAGLGRPERHRHHRHL